MGQYGNQPDFGTRGVNLEASGDAFPEIETPGSSWDAAALYVGTGGDLYVDLVGGNGGAYYTLFKNVPSGTFMPIIVNKVWATVDGNPATTCADFVALY
jgi:hypothetical protein